MLRSIYKWHFLLETLLLTIILFSWVGGRKCQLSGLTGGIGCGKSTAAEIMINEKLPVINCDQIAHKVIENMSKRIIKEFPLDDISDKNGLVDREKLGNVVFNNKAKLKKLNELSHLRIGWAIIKEILYRKFVLWEKYLVLDMPLLFETRFFAYICFPIILVYIDNKDIQIKRIIERSNGKITQEEAIQRIESQMGMEYKKKNSDVLIDNEGTIEDLHRQILSKLFPFLVMTID